MISSIKSKLFAVIFWLLIAVWCVCPWHNFVEATPPKYNLDFASHLKKEGWVLKSERFWVSTDKTLRENIVEFFYPRYNWVSAIYDVLRGITLWVMIIFIIVSWASLLLNKKPEESKKHLFSLLYIMLWWVFIYAANRLFWTILNFNVELTTWPQQGLWWFTESFIWEQSVFFVILSAIKAFAFFLAIIMIVVTWFKVMAAWEWEKWKKLVKWIINVVVALLIIKWVDFIYYLAADSSTFVKNASDFIINVARVFGYIYGVIIVIMVIVAWYLFITDGWDGSKFKNASNVLVNILLSALVLFAFLLISYQIFAEFQKWWDAVADEDQSTTVDTTDQTPNYERNVRNLGWRRNAYIPDVNPNETEEP